MSMTTTKYIFHAVMAGMLLLGVSCDKNKMDVRPGNEPNYSNMAKSTVRLITFNKTDLIVNNTRVTNWYVPTATNPVDLPYPTPYFPVSGKFNGSWYLPQQFLDSKGQATIQSVTMPNFITDSFQVQEDYYKPTDYYLATSAVAHMGGIYTVSAVPRSTAIPADPRHIRIRLVNIGMAAGNGGGTLSLAYANGTPVNAATSGIANHRWSDYIEIPYGTYQFKVLIDGSGLQIPGRPALLTDAATQENFSLGGTQVYYSAVQTFQPGGVYTIVVAQMPGVYQYREYPLYPNCFDVITDVDPAANITYGRLQLVNAFDESEKGLSILLDDTQVPSVTYGNAGDYTILVAGTHHIKATDAAGKTIIEKDVTIRGGDNLTLWAFPNKDNSIGMTVIPNNMGGIRNTGTNADGGDGANNSYDPLKYKVLVQTRFLNFCPDLPYVTFTNPNGRLFTEGLFSAAPAAQQLQPGLAPSPVAVPYPYIDLGVVTGGAVEAYQSQPGVLPGNRLINVPALTKMDFVKMPAMYFLNGNAGAESGVYTVALIGRNSSSQHPRMIVVKHNQ
ncbi:hypothetical protein DVR12_22635 [Chitinophaga silvatica]|uniref:DUF4397 domain-containing protein n=2 Tax=Chitinophaga silvatica TaxID=2282649 RepID=A0A3E1Y431_9BACT|nr:hypothetical protein DVR12_22635 [Chitinophaga silvatica]